MLSSPAVRTMTNKRASKVPPSFRKMLEDINNMGQLARLLSVASPLLRAFGIDVAGMRDALDKQPLLAAKAQELTGILDRFNNQFASRGWIAYDSLSLEVARAAIATAEAGDL